MKKWLNLFLIISVFSVAGLLFYSSLDSTQAQSGISITARIESICGDGVIDGGEECDGSNLGGQTCAGLGLGYTSGTLSCDSCSFDVSGCTTTAPPSVGGGGGGVTIPTKVILSGRAYPGSDVHVLSDGKLTETVKADAEANFKAEIKDITPGVWSFSVWAKDKNNIKSITYTLTFQVNANTITTVSGIFLPSTIGLNKTSLNKGEILNVFGQTIPEIEVKVHVFSTEYIETVVSDNIGVWLLPFDTIVLEDGSHAIKAQSQITPEEKSGFGQILSFYVGEDRGIGDLDLFCLYADLNKDGRVNLIDFSILLYWFGKYNTCADQNRNDVVDLPDFSIMLYHWTG